jgi:predicted ATP-grasp superfamily ATP-dependent carboligase
MEKLFDFKNKLELWRWYRLVSLQTVHDSVLGSVLVVYEEKSKMISTSINKKESRLLLLVRR